MTSLTDPVNSAKYEKYDALADAAHDDPIRNSLDTDVPGSESDAEADPSGSAGGHARRRRAFSFRKLWLFTGPGWLMSLAFTDPGNLESDVQAGAYSGFTLLWILFWATAMGLLLQIMSARLGVVTGKHLAEVCRDQYPKPARIALWLMMELAIIGSDIQEVVGSGIAINILSQGRIPIYGGVIITAVDTFSFLLLERWGVRKLEAFFGTLIAIMVFTFGAEYVIAAPPQKDVIEGVIIPRLGSDSRVVECAVGMLGAVVMPHNLYLHSALVQSRKVDTRRQDKVREANFYFFIESTIALVFSFVVNLFVVAVFATMYSNGFPQNETIGLKDAGDRLQTYFGHKLGGNFGDAAKYIWAVGLLASGQASTSTGTYAGQFVMDGFLKLKLSAWRRVLFTRTVAIVPAVVTALLARDDLDEFDQWLNVLQSIQLPFALLPVLKFTSDAAIMGTFTNKAWVTVLAWLSGLLVLAVNVYLVEDFVDKQVAHTPLMWVVLSVLAALYLFFVIYLVLGPATSARFWARLRGGAGGPHHSGQCAPNSDKAARGVEADEQSRLLQPDD